MKDLLSPFRQTQPSLSKYCLMGSEGLHSIPWQELAARFAIISDSHVSSLYSGSVASTLKKLGLAVEEISFPAGELHKTRETKAWIEDSLLERGFGKNSCLIALGGGATLDLVGFVAATYCRGIALVLFPTTLLAMVDACIGGKTGVNTPSGKNLIGAFYPPSWIWIDPLFLQTLPAAEWQNGWAEIVKIAAVLSLGFFVELEHLTLPIYNLQLIKPIIAQSCNLKHAVVIEDPYDRGKRQLLNFGHTVGHALETLFSYQIPHGQAVAVGMLIEGHIACQKTLFPISAWNRLYALLLRYGVDLKLPRIPSAEELFFFMQVDKKNHYPKEPRCIQLREIGEAATLSNGYSFPLSSLELTQALVSYAHAIYI